MSTSPAPSQSAALQSALDQLWTRFLPEMQARLTVVQAAAVALAAGPLSTEQQSAACAAAHKLTGSLGAFGLHEATVQAREAELLLSPESTPTPANAPRLTDLASSLSAIVSSR